MKNLVEHIINKNYEAANLSLEEAFQHVMKDKIHEMKKMYAAKMSEQNTHSERQKRLRMGVLEEDDIEEGLLKVAKDKLKLLSPSSRANMKRPVMRNISGKPMQKIKIEPKRLEEENDEQTLSEAPRVGIVKLRIRGGKVQRRKKVSNVPGMTLRGGKLTRMSASERRKRKLGAKMAARKTKAKKSQILRKRKMSLMKRQRLGG
jgi:hypothetical protein